VSFDCGRNIKRARVELLQVDAKTEKLFFLIIDFTFLKDLPFDEISALLLKLFNFCHFNIKLILI